MEIKCLIFAMSFEWSLEIENGFTQLYTHEDRSIISCRSGAVITYRVTDHVFWYEYWKVWFLQSLMKCAVFFCSLFLIWNFERSTGYKALRCIGWETLLSFIVVKRNWGMTSLSLRRGRSLLIAFKVEWFQLIT